MENSDKLLLLVEDNEDDIFLMKRALKVAGVQNPLVVVRDGEAALAYLSGSGEFGDRVRYPYPSLVFLDLKLPYRSGLEVLAWRQQQESLPKTIFIVVTSSNEPKDLNEAYRLGASSYVVKPPTAEQLIEIATAFRLYWLGCNSFAIPSVP
jgi:CheY-like chemotaxis protein